jgi:hypothetical protein
MALVHGEMRDEDLPAVASILKHFAKNAKNVDVTLAYRGAGKQGEFLLTDGAALTDVEQWHM